MTHPNIEERLTAAAVEILTDAHRHSREAKVWAVKFIRQAAKGRPTAFQRRSAGREAVLQ